MVLNGDRVIAAALEDALAEREIVRGHLGEAFDGSAPAGGSLGLANPPACAATRKNRFGPCSRPPSPGADAIAQSAELWRN
jgi:hypothetical protein